MSMIPEVVTLPFSEDEEAFFAHGEVLHLEEYVSDFNEVDDTATRASDGWFSRLGELLRVA